MKGVVYRPHQNCQQIYNMLGIEHMRCWDAGPDEPIWIAPLQDWLRPGDELILWNSGELKIRRKVIED